ncbi:DUF3244 domain-containing protein [Chitinispirillales bacterium ANBcel5]|uniref:GH39 family glycosyl hydrolase n=1 Tax=Cellulosispirillum alkaliphilum TaxID=3039283 RepID=UPI002A5426C5|nr:DUF3244 domain-containing protein [Chitinispirillales bacterium ANBcel5]
MLKVLMVSVLMFSTVRLEAAEENIVSHSVTIDGSNVMNTLSDYFFGHNYWMWAPTWGDQVSGTESLVSDLNLSLMRFGGIQVDLGYPDSVTEAVMSQFIEYCADIGAEPLVQLQIARYSTTEERVAGAVKMFNYYRTLYPVKYVAIGNEPDLYSSDHSNNPEYNAPYLSGYTVDDYCNDFNAVAEALRAIDPDIKLVGLELSHRYNQWVPQFIEQCRDNVDILSVHYYPFNAAQCTYSNARNSFSSFNTFYDNIRNLIDENADGKDIPLLIGETNISWDGDPAHSTRDASPGTFNAGLWFADYVGVSAAQHNLFSIMPWSISEGWTLGFLGANRRPKPVYHVYKMFSNNSKEHLIHIESVNPFLRVYTFKDDQENVAVFAVNWDTLSSYSLDINFTNILNDSSFNYEVPPHSVSSIVISSDFSQKEFLEYNSSMQAPTAPTTSVVQRSKGLSGGKKAGLNVSLRTEGAVLALSLQNPLSGVKVDIVDLQGRTVRSMFTGNSEAGKQIRIPLEGVPKGTYMVKIASGNEVLAQRRFVLRTGF